MWMLEGAWSLRVSQRVGSRYKGVIVVKRVGGVRYKPVLTDVANNGSIPFGLTISVPEPDLASLTSRNDALNSGAGDPICPN